MHEFGWPGVSTVVAFGLLLFYDALAYIITLLRRCLGSRRAKTGRYWLRALHFEADFTALHALVVVEEVGMGSKEHHSVSCLSVTYTPTKHGLMNRGSH